MQAKYTSSSLIAKRGIILPLSTHTLSITIALIIIETIYVHTLGIHIHIELQQFKKLSIKSTNGNALKPRIMIIDKK